MALVKGSLRSLIKLAKASREETINAQKEEIPENLKSFTAVSKEFRNSEEDEKEGRRNLEEVSLKNSEKAPKNAKFLEEISNKLVEKEANLSADFGTIRQPRLQGLLQECRLNIGYDEIFCLSDWINPLEEDAIIKCLEDDSVKSWTCLKGRKAKIFGGKVTKEGLRDVEELPDIITGLIHRMELEDVFEEHQRPNHVLVNKYMASEGLLPHSDGPAYMPQVVILSLGSHTLMDFYLSPRFTSPQQARNPLFSVYLPARSLLKFTHSIYSDLLHGIDARSYDNFIEGSNICNLPRRLEGKSEFRGSRISLTLRKVPHCRDALQ